MKSAKSRQCLCCSTPFEAEPRNAHHQKYCSKPPCRKASKAASQRLWLAKPENVNYHSGPDAVARVSDWQKAHPEYRERQKIKRQAALQVFCAPQPVESMNELPVLPSHEEILSFAAPPCVTRFHHCAAICFCWVISTYLQLYATR